MIAIGMVIRTVRETGKAPKVYSCLKEAGLPHPTSAEVRNLTAALQKLVYYQHKDGSASLYKQNYDANEITDKVLALAKTMNIPAKVYNRKPKQETPKQEDSPKVPTYDCIGKLDFSGMSDDELSAISYEIDKEFKRRKALRESQARAKEILTLLEMSKEDLINIINTI